MTRPDLNGPFGWTYDGSSDYSIGAADDPQAKRIANVWCPDHTYGTRLCNLLAAAPDLLIALKQAHACATIRPDGTCDGCSVNDAIALAEGRIHNHFWDNAS